VQTLINQLDTVEGSLADIETDVRTNQIDTTIYERVKAKLTIQREDSLEDIEQAQLRHDQLKGEDQWLSALLNLTIDAERFERGFSDKKKRDWLSKIVERIDVFYRHEDQVHELNLMLKIPLFSDEFLGIKTHKSDGFIKLYPLTNHSTVTDLARFRGWSTSVPL